MNQCLHKLSEEEVVGQDYLVENTEEVVRPLGSWSQGGIRAHKGVVAEGSFVNIVERAHFLISRVFPREKLRKSQREQQTCCVRGSLGRSQQLQPGAQSTDRLMHFK